MDEGEQLAQRTTAFLVGEKRRRGRPVADRVTRWRRLTAGTRRSVRAAAPVRGESERPRPRWWALDTPRGLEALVQGHPGRGRPAQVRPEAWAARAVERRTGRMARLQEAPRD